MAKNNLGVCHLELGEFDCAKRFFKEDLVLDPLYPLPHYNLAILEMCREDKDECLAHLAEAARLGYTGGTLDKLAQRSKSIYARMEPTARHTG